MVGTRRSSGIERAALAARPRRLLSRGGWANPDVSLVETEAGPVVVKDYAPRSPLVRRGLGPWLLAREARAIERLAGQGAVPRLLGWLDDQALVLEYRPGTFLSRSLAGRVPADFLARLERAIAEMHDRGVVHLDLRHRSNVLAGDDGRPVVVDFASALVVDPRTRWGRGIVRWLGRLDHRALRKWRARIGSPSAQPASSGRSDGSRGASRPM